MTRPRARPILLCLSLLFLVACTAGQPGAPETERPAQTRILFVGNSYTFYNELPEIFADLARAGDQDVEVDLSAQGGWTLAKHAQARETLDKIGTGPWDYVVLQEQSVLPTQPDRRQQLMVPAVRLLDGKIDQAGAETVLFMTWGRRDGFAEAGYPDFEAMQAALATGYLEVGSELEALVAPVGIAWQKAQELDPHLDLWQADGSHPTETGSYLAAAVFYALIFGQSPEGLAYSAGLPEETARSLQSVAAETVLAEPERWNLGQGE